MTRLSKFLAVILILTIWTGHISAEVIWSDEFNGNTIDKSIWTYDIGGHGFGNGQLEYNTARSENSYIENGNLVLEARRENYSGNAFTSVRMLTQGRFAFLYGSLEARIKVPDTANGIWPAFWMLGNNFPAIGWPQAGEVDILEIGGSEGIKKGLQHRRINSALHFANASNQKQSLVEWHDAPVDLHTDYHRYKLDWTPEKMTFYLDDIQYAQWDITPDYMREYHQPYFILLNLAVGSWENSYTGLNTPEKITAPFPVKMYVDWIRLTKNAHTKMFIGKKEEKTGRFGVFTESPQIKQRLNYGNSSAADFAYKSDASINLWNNLTPSKKVTDPAEGKSSLSYDIAPNNWFGMGIFTPNFSNMNRYSNGTLHFDIKTTAAVDLRVGIKSSRGGEAWLAIGNESAEFGFPRDGKWHSIELPLTRFANIDFMTIHQFFMLTGRELDKPATLSIDNIWWEPGPAKPKPQPGTFGIMTENPAHKTAGECKEGKNSNFYIWENTLEHIKQAPFEGKNSLSLKSRPGQWFGCSFTAKVKFNLTAYDTKSSTLHLAMKTNSKTPFKIGMKSGTLDDIGQKWITFTPENDPYNFKRDGQWHQLTIPLHDFTPEVDLTDVSQLFELLGTDGPIEAIEFDDIYISSAK